MFEHPPKKNPVGTINSHPISHRSGSELVVDPNARQTEFVKKGFYCGRQSRVRYTRESVKITNGLTQVNWYTGKHTKVQNRKGQTFDDPNMGKTNQNNRWTVPVEARALWHNNGAAQGV